MAAEVVLGKNEFTLTETQHVFIDGEGWRAVRTWQGPQALRADFVNTVKAANAVRIYSRTGVPAEVQAEFIDTDNLLDDSSIWELRTSPMDRPLATHPAFASSGASPAAIEDIEESIRKGVASGTDFNDKYGFTNLNAYRNLRLKGVDSYRMWSFVISKTFSSSKGELLPPEEANTQKVVKYNAIGIPGFIKWSQPSIKYWDGIEAKPLPVDEWLAGPPSYRYEGRKYTISRDWVGAIKWYELLYEGGTAASDDDGQSYW